MGELLMKAFLKFCVESSITVLLILAANLASAQGQFANVELDIVPVAGNVYMIQRPGGGGNIGAFVGPEGVLLVDSLFAPLADKVVAAVKTVSNEDIRFLINTHIHIDHVGGNQNLANRGCVDFCTRQYPFTFS